MSPLMSHSSMSLRILLPFEVFAEHDDVLRIVAETAQGSYGLLPNRLDCFAALSPGIFTYVTSREGEQFVAVAEGILVKTGRDVRLSVRRAMAGADIGDLRRAVGLPPSRAVPRGARHDQSLRAYPLRDGDELLALPTRHIRENAGRECCGNIPAGSAEARRSPAPSRRRCAERHRVRQNSNGRSILGDMDECDMSGLIRPERSGARA